MVTQRLAVINPPSAPALVTAEKPLAPTTSNRRESDLTALFSVGKVNVGRGDRPHISNPDASRVTAPSMRAATSGQPHASISLSAPRTKTFPSSNSVVATSRRTVGAARRSEGRGPQNQAPKGRPSGTGPQR